MFWINHNKFIEAGLQIHIVFKFHWKTCSILSLHSNALELLWFFSNYQTKYSVIKNGKDGLKTIKEICSPDDIPGNTDGETTCFALNRCVCLGGGLNGEEDWMVNY